jgi:hypothetical protein
MNGRNYQSFVPLLQSITPQLNSKIIESDKSYESHESKKRYRKL